MFQINFFLLNFLSTMKKKYEDDETSYAHHFFPSEGSNIRYVIEMNTGIFNYDVELSKENFNEILNSIKIK